MPAIQEKGAVSAKFDLIIVGTGMSGINCAHRLQSQLPGLSWTVLERRDDIGGTWDLFKYPGIRSDSDLYSYGFEWARWPFSHPIAEAHLIKSYLRDTIEKHHIAEHIRFRHKVLSAEWSSKTQAWTLTVDFEGQKIIFETSFFVQATGYYDYDSPLKTTIPGIKKFQGEVIHPQFWPANYDCSNKKVAIIGSGATAVSLLPKLAKKAALVTMIQRSPSHIVSSMNENYFPEWLCRRLPIWLTSKLNRFLYVMFTYLFVTYCKYFPQSAGELVRKDVTKRLPDSIQYDPHFKPRHRVWEQRVCLAPGGDFFETLHRNARVVTGIIEDMSDDSIRIRDGQVVKADTIVTATGLRMNFGGHISLRVDNVPVSWAKKLVWNGAMIEGVPNMFFMVGYTNGSWTMGVDGTAFIICRLLKYMSRNRVTSAIPRPPKAGTMGTQGVWQLAATYVDKADGEIPVYGTEGPWKPRTNPPQDWLHSRYGNITNGLQFLT
jgi:cation diffusion facilitator CzcD-associated flavoprotein CzcO